MKTFFIIPDETYQRLGNLKFHYHIHRSHLLNPIPSQLNPVHIPARHVRKIHFNIIFTRIPRRFPFRFSDQTVVCISHLSHAW